MNNLPPSLVAPLLSSKISAAYLEACYLDVEAFKPGNVSHAVPGHGMEAQAFIVSADVSASPLTQSGLALGEKIFRAVERTRDAVGCNTNLGILLLCAPLALAAGRRYETASQLQQNLKWVIDQAGIVDSHQVFQAICLAAPGGLGDSGAHDVKDPVDTPLKQVMAYAAERDRIAAQYASGFADLFTQTLPAWTEIEALSLTESEAVTGLYLKLLATWPDTHIVRKQGSQSASRVQAEAAGLYLQWRDHHQGAVVKHALVRFDRLLKEAGINPGTTADLTVATLFLAGLLKAASRSNWDYSHSYVRVHSTLFTRTSNSSH